MKVQSRLRVDMTMKLVFPAARQLRTPAVASARLCVAGIAVNASRAAAKVTRAANILVTVFLPYERAADRVARNEMVISSLPPDNEVYAFAGAPQAALRFGRLKTLVCAAALPEGVAKHLRDSHHSFIKASLHRHDAPLLRSLFGDPEPGDRGHAAPERHAKACRHPQLRRADALPALRRPHDRAGNVRVCRGRGDSPPLAVRQLPAVFQHDVLDQHKERARPPE